MRGVVRLACVSWPDRLAALAKNGRKRNEEKAIHPSPLHRNVNSVSRGNDRCAFCVTGLASSVTWLRARP